LPVDKWFLFLSKLEAVLDRAKYKMVGRISCNKQDHFDDVNVVNLILVQQENEKFREGVKATDIVLLIAN
jgi:hypothetical protein